MDMNYEIRSGNEPDVEEALREAEQHCQTDTKEKERGEAESNLRIEIEQAKYKVSFAKRPFSFKSILTH